MIDKSQKDASGRSVIALLSGLIVMFGGSAQFFLLSDIVVRLAALVLIVFVAASAGSHLKPSKAAMAFFLLAVAIPALQLVPIPYEMWTRLPGMAESARLLEAVSSKQVSRAVSIAPTRTFDSLLFMVVPIAGFSLGLRSDAKMIRFLSSGLVIIAVLSAIVGCTQLLAGHLVDLHPYRVTNEGSAVGIFANRNHQAIFLIMAVLFAARLSIFRENDKVRTVVRFLAVVFLSACALLSESRAGAILLGVALIALLLGSKSLQLGLPSFGSSRARLIATAGFFVVGLTVLLAVGGGVTARFSRSFEEPFNRMEGIQIAISAIIDFWLTGSGIGSFEWLAPSYENQSDLSFAYWNHAHNDWLQLVLEGGVAGCVLILVAAYFMVSRSFRIVKGKGLEGDRYPFLVLCLICLFLAIIHSLVDYPMRTASVSFLVFWCAGVIDASHAQAQRRIWTRFNNTRWS